MNILVTGASSGIGRATAKLLDRAGYQLVLVARRQELLDNLQKELINSSLVYPFDLQELEKIEEIFRVCQENGIKLDGLVHCAGVGVTIPVKSNSIEQMTSIMQTNYFSFIELGKYFSMRMYSNKNSAIVAVSSISSLVCYPGSAAYAASKSAINAAVRVMSKEFMRRKIRVNAILPAYVDSPMGPSKDDTSYIAQQPLGIIEPEYIAYMVEYLLSEKAKYMTGTLIPISGGMAY